MSFEYTIEIKETFSYSLFLNTLLTNCRNNRNTKNVRILDDKLELLDDSTWGIWFQLYYEDEINFWMNAHKIEREIVLNILTETLYMLGISEYRIEEA